MTLSDDKIEKIKKLREIGKKLHEIAEIVGCNINTAHRYSESIRMPKLTRKSYNRRAYLKRKSILKCSDGIIICPSCGEEFEGRHPKHGYTLCELCYG